MKFSAFFMPTSLFSLKDSDSTNSGAKSLFLPSPYAVKMAILNQAITAGNQLEVLSAKNSKEFAYISKTRISFSIYGGFCVNKSFIKIQRAKREDVGFQSTVSFREFIHIPQEIEIIFETENEEAGNYLMKYIYKINYFGKRASFFQFLSYNKNPLENNVKQLDTDNFLQGIIQQYDDFPKDATFEKVNNYSSKSIKRDKKLFVIPVISANSSKSYSSFHLF